MVAAPLDWKTLNVMLSLFWTMIVSAQFMCVSIVAEPITVLKADLPDVPANHACLAPLPAFAANDVL